MEISKDNVEEYYSPKDFQLGQTVTLLSRRFLLYDCDRFTKEYYQQNYPEMELKPIDLPKKTETLPEKKKVTNWTLSVKSYIIWYALF